MWVQNGNLKGPQGDNGKSAYELAVEEGFIGTLADWQSSLVGANGEKGEHGQSAAYVTFTDRATYEAYVPGPLETKVYMGAT